MTVYVDPAIHKWRNDLWGHLTSDGGLEELHVFAQSIGLKREWFQDPVEDGISHPHYDVNVSKRALAVERGATEQSSEESVQRFRAWRLADQSPDSVECQAIWLPSHDFDDGSSAPAFRVSLSGAEKDMFFLDQYKAREFISGASVNRPSCPETHL